MTDTTQQDRQHRAARNQALFREVNERLEKVTTRLGLDRKHMRFVCECATEDCTETLDMTPQEYEAVRAVANHFLVAPNEAHLWPEVERVVDRHDEYWVVEKFDEGGRVAAKLDPRSRPTGINR